MFPGGGGRAMIREKGLDEVHEIIEAIYEEEKNLTAEQRVIKVREESEKFMVERKLVLKRIAPAKSRYAAIK